MDVVIRIGGRAVMKPGGGPCPHLNFDGTNAACAVHAEPWFKDTPCHVYGNPDIDPDYSHTREKPCRVGAYIQERGGLIKLKMVPGESRDLEDLGPWI